MSEGLTQREVGEHLGLSQPQVSQWLAELGLSLSDGLDRIRISYIEALRAAAAGNSPSEERDAYYNVRRRTAELRLAKEAGHLVAADPMRKAIRDVGREVRDAVAGIPYRLDPLLRHVPDERERFKLWERELRTILNNLARQIAALGGSVE